MYLRASWAAWTGQHQARWPWTLGIPCPICRCQGSLLVGSSGPRENDELEYGISGSPCLPHFFSVTSNTGEVKLASLLDYEVKKENSLGRPSEGQGGGQGPGGYPNRALSCLSLCPLQTLYWFAITISVATATTTRVSQQGGKG